MNWTYKVIVAKDPALISKEFPTGAPWEGSITPRIRKMTDGVPQNDPETGRFSVPRVFDPEYTKTAAVVALTEETLAALYEANESGVPTYERLSLELYDSRAAARPEHPELDWDSLGYFAGVDF